MLVPPVDENQDHGEESDYGPNERNRENIVLSDGLRDQFETMKTAWRRARRSTGESPSELRRKEHEAALDTAVAIDSEMAMWNNGIAELEAMLAEEEGNYDYGESSDNEVQARPQDVIQFPSLPPIIAAEEDVDKDSLSGEENPSPPSTEL